MFDLKSLFLFFFDFAYHNFQALSNELMQSVYVCAVFVNRIHIPRRHTHAHCANMEC